MSAVAWIAVVSIAVNVLMAIGAVLLPGWLRSTIRTECQTLTDKVDDHDGRLAALEQWQRLVASDVRKFPGTHAVLDRLEKTIDKTDNTLERLNATLATMSERIAKLEGRAE